MNLQQRLEQIEKEYNKQIAENKKLDVDDFLGGFYDESVIQFYRSQIEQLVKEIEENLKIATKEAILSLNGEGFLNSEQVADRIIEKMELLDQKEQ